MRFPFFIALLICGLGILSLSRIPQDIDPPDIVPTESIVAYFSGVNPDKLDRMVTQPVERVLNAIPNIGDVSSKTTDGISAVSFQLTKKANREETLGIIRDRLSQLRSALQLEAPLLIGPNLKANSGQVASGFLLLTEANVGKKPDFEKVRRAAKGLIEKFRSSAAIATAEISHDQLRAIVIRYEDESLADAGLTPRELAEFIRANSQQFPGGYISGKNQFLALDIGRGISDVESLRDLPVRDPRDGSLTPLSDVCKISVEPLDPAFGEVFLNDQRALGITFTKAESATWETLSNSISKIIESETNAATSLFFYRGETTSDLIQASSWTILFSILAVLICVTIGLGLRAGFSVAIAVATTLLGTIFLLHLFGIELNIVTLAALAVGIGLLIDNHIVITHHVGLLRLQKPVQALNPQQCCWHDLATPLIVAAATTALGFLPAWLLKGETAGYVSSLFIVIGTLLFVSQIIGFTITPSLAPHFSKGGRFLNFLSEKLFGKGAPLALTAKQLIVIFVLFSAITCAAFWKATETPMATIPTRHLDINIKLGPGSSPEGTRTISEKIRKELASEFSHPIATFLNVPQPTVFRGTTPQIPSANQATLSMAFPSAEEFPHIVALETKLAKLLPKGASLQVSPLAATPTNPFPVAFRLHAPSSSFLGFAKAKDADFALVNEAARISAISVIPDLESAAEQKITTSEIALGALAATGGIPVTLLSDEIGTANRLPILLKVASNDPDAEDRLEEAYVHRQSGGSPIPLQDVASIKRVDTPTIISRWNGANVGYLAFQTTSNSITEEQRLLTRFQKRETDTLTVEPIGDFAQSQKTREQILRHAAYVAIGIFLLLLIQTRTIRSVGIILLGLIPALLGASLVMFLISGSGTMQLLGLIALIGIVVNNAIVLIDRLRTEQAKTGAEIAAVAQSRFGPIALSSACAILGLLPLALGGNALWAPFAAVMIGGLLFGGASVLILLPALWKRLQR